MLTSIARSVWLSTALTRRISGRALKSQRAHTDGDLRRFDSENLLEPTAFHCTCKGALLIVSSRSQNRWVDLLQGINLWKSSAIVARTLRIILTREILSSTWSEPFREVLVLLSVNTDLVLRTQHVLAQQDQDRSSK